MTTASRSGVRGAGWAALLLAAGLAGPSFAQNDSGRAGEDLEPGKLLVASRQLSDPNFRQTVVLIVEYDRRTGALGLVINRPSEVELASVLPGREGAAEILAKRVLVGGPVEPTRLSLLIRAASEPEGAELIFADVYLSGSHELLERLVAAPAEGEAFRAYAGYAGWAPGQLEAEMAVGGWHLVDGRPAILFEHPIDQIWSRLILIGTAEWAQWRFPGDRAGCAIRSAG